MKNLYLIGFMGAGKSTIARALAKKCPSKRIEMDQLIEEQQGMAITDIFAAHGENYFRDLETELLRSFSESTGYVVSCGGGSVLRDENAALMKENGCIVYEFSRRSIPMEGVTHLSVDVTDEDAVNAAVQQVIQKETKIDAVINCAGFGISGAVEFTSMEQAKAQFDVNFFGTVTVNKAVLPFMRHQGKGHIVNISSVAAVAHIPFQTFYSASKAAVSSYSYALANEVKPYGIHVTVVELGDICTGFTKARQKSILGDDEYGGRISRSVSQMEHDEQNGMDPARIGRYIAGIVEKKNPAVVYVAGAQYKFLSLLCKLLPAAARGKIVGKIYG